MHPNQKSTFSFIVIGVFSPGLVGKGVIVGLAVVVVGPPDDDDECLLALTFVTITHNGVATNREMTYVNI